MDKNRIFKLIVSIVLPLIIVSIRPLGMDLNQSIVLGTLVLILIWWTTGIVHRTHASIFLLIMFAVFGGASLKTVLRFPLSSNFYTIALSFLLSQGIVNSNVANRFSNFALNKYGNTPYKLILMSFVFGALMIFIIPQQFSRVIILAFIYEQFLKERKVDDDAKEVLFYSVFVGSISTCMFFKNGDILLNYSALEFADISMNWVEWAKYMVVPTLFTSILAGVAFILTFGGRLRGVKLDTGNDEVTLGEIGFKEKTATIIMGIVLILWMTEQLHSVDSAIIALLGTLAMFGFKIIESKDFKSLNIGLMIFLTAAFAIGGVMNQSGVADIIYSNIIGIFPPTYSNVYLAILVLTVMALHMLLGSSITTFSVVIPVLMELTRGVLGVIPLMFLVYITVNMHHILPFHHVVVMIGAGNNYFSNRVTIKYGLVLTVLVFLVIFGFYMPWWKFIGLV